MKEIVIEINGVRHKLVPSIERETKYWCLGCSLNGVCPNATTGVCLCQTLCGSLDYHFEKE
jgi:hypothetical protein